MNTYTLIVPTLEKDFPKLLNNIEWFYKYLPIDSICIIGNEALKELLPTGYQIKYFNETKLVNCHKLKQIISEHMLINTKLMISLLNEIESNNDLKEEIFLYKAFNLSCVILLI